MPIIFSNINIALEIDFQIFFRRWRQLGKKCEPFVAANETRKRLRDSKSFKYFDFCSKDAHIFFCSILDAKLIARKSGASSSEPRAAGWEARMLPVQPPPQTFCGIIFQKLDTIISRASSLFPTFFRTKIIVTERKPLHGPGFKPMTSSLRYSCPESYLIYGVVYILIHLIRCHIWGTSSRWF